jgi:pilus assembly protein CpaE
MAELKLLIAGKDKRFQKRVKAILKDEKEIRFVGETTHGQEVLDLCLAKNPDICLVDEEIDELSWQEVTESVATGSSGSMVVVILNKYTKGSMKEAISNGAKEILEKPSLSRSLLETLLKLYHREAFLREEFQNEKRLENQQKDAHILSVFSPKGGVGKTTVTANTSVSLSLEGKKVLVIDANLQFGDSSMALQISPGLTITDLVKDMSPLTELEPEEYLAKHSSGVYVLSAPIKPEDAEWVTPAHIKEIVNTLKSKFQYIILDCPNYFNELVLSCFDLSHQVLLISTLDITTIKNIRNALNLIYSLGYGKEKFQIVLNKVNEKFGIQVKEFEETIGLKVWKVIPYDDRFVVETLNIGIPCVMKNPKNKVSKAFLNLGMGILKGNSNHPLKGREKKKSNFLIWKFSR